MSEKYDIIDVRDRIIQEGIGYAIMDYMDGSCIADPVLAKMWDDAADLLNKICAYVHLDEAEDF